eukprot:11779976-Karenia_brevis.AAC.1
MSSSAPGDMTNQPCITSHISARASRFGVRSARAHMGRMHGPARVRWPGIIARGTSVLVRPRRILPRLRPRPRLQLQPLPLQIREDMTTKESCEANPCRA